MEEFEYDVVIYGTGLVNCLVASILTKNKFKVLHIDKYSEYGNNYRTLTFRQLLELKNLVPLTSSTKVNDPSTSTGSDTAVNRYISDSSLSSLDSSSTLNLTKRTSTLETGDRLDSLDSSNGPGTLSSLNSISSINSSLNPQTNDETLDENLTSRSESGHLVTNSRQLQDYHQIYYKVDPFGENQEGVLNNLMKQSNSFNIDLWPRILLNNTMFTDFLVYTNIHKQLQLCTNINTNVLFTYESYLMTSDATNAVNGSVSDGRTGKGSSSSSAEEGVEHGKGDTNSTADKETKEDDHKSTANTEGVEEELKDDMSTSSTNDGIEPGSQTKSDKSEEKHKASSSSSNNKNISKTTALLFELVHDKNSIFRSKYLDLKEKRLLTRFINTSLFGSTGVKASNNRRKSNKEGEDEDVEEEGENEDKLDKKGKRESRRKSKKENDGDSMSSGVDKDVGGSGNGSNEEEVNESWVEYLKKNNLNEKLINLVNCMRLSVVNGVNKNQCKLELSNYLKSFKVGNDKTATENKSCIIYCLYGTNNLIQHLCRLSSLNNCHYMLNHEIKDMEVVERSVYSRVNSIVSTKSETSNKDDNDTSNTDGDDNTNEATKKDTNEDANKGNDPESTEARETSSDNELNRTDSGDSNNTKILLHLDGYEIYTNYVITEYPVSTTATINRVNSSEDDSTESIVDSGTDKKLLVVCMISDRMVLDDINMCMVIPGSSGETDKNNASGSKDNDGASSSDDKVDQSTSDDWTVILQTCKDSQSSPEGMYVVYFMSISSTSSNSSGTGYNPDVKEGKGSVGNNEVSEESEKHDSNVLRMVNMYKSLVGGDMKHMLFMSYGYYRMDNEIEVISNSSTDDNSMSSSNASGSNEGSSSNSNSKGDRRNNSATNIGNDSSRTTDSNNSADGTSREEQSQSVNHLTVYSNKYKNDSLLVFMNELKISEKVAELVLRLNNEKRSKKSEDSEDGESASAKVGEKGGGEVDFEQYLKCIVPEEDDQVDINCDFFMDFVNKFF